MTDPANLRLQIAAARAEFLSSGVPASSEVPDLIAAVREYLVAGENA